MRKLALGGALALISMNALAADDFKVQLGGRMDTQYGVIHDSGNFRNTTPAQPSSSNKMRSNGLVTDSRIDVNIDATSDKGFKYGGSIRLFADTSLPVNSSPFYGDQNKVYIESNKIGRFEFGNTPGAPDLLELDIDNFEVGTYGVNGYWSTWLADKSYKWSSAFKDTKYASLGVQSAQFIATPVLFTNYSSNGYSNAPKVNYFTKPLDEITIGLSYTPDLDSRGTVSGMSYANNVSSSDQRGNPATFKNIYGLGVMLDKKFGDYGVKINFSGVAGQAKLKVLRDLRAYETGALFNYKSFKFGSTYGTWGNSLTFKANNTPGRKTFANYWTLGLGQELEKFGYSLTYLNSNKAGGLESLAATALGGYTNTLQKLTDTSANNLKSMVLDLDYAIAPGFKAYVAGSKFRIKESGGQVDNGNLLILGTRLLF